MRLILYSSIMTHAILLIFGCLVLAGTPVIAVVEAESSPGFDITPFALPNGPPGEIRFEETRDIVAVDIEVDGPVPESLGLSYLQENWPGTALELANDLSQPCQFGWSKVDDWFNGHWKRAATRVTRTRDGHAHVEFEPLTREFPQERDYDVRFRRTLGVRIEGVKAEAIKQVQDLHPVGSGEDKSPRHAQRRWPDAGNECRI